MARHQQGASAVLEEAPDSDPSAHGKHARAPRSMWSGSISFGLVNIPVSMQPAIKKKTVHFHLVHDKDNARLKRRYVCSLEHKEVPDDEVKKAYDTAPDEHVIVEKEELEAIAPRGTRTIDILYFVDHTEIDPAYFDKPYYLMPNENAKKAYALLAHALEHSGKAGICQYIIRNRQYIGIVRAVKGVLSLENMHFDDEVITVDELKWHAPKVAISDREVKAAGDLIESLTTPFAPKKLHDTYREAVLKLIDRKKSKAVITEPTKEEKEESGVIDLMAALQKSLEEVKKHKTRKVA